MSDALLRCAALLFAVATTSNAIRFALRRRAPAVDVIVKLGGSAITTKNNFETLDDKALAAAADQIAAGAKRSVVVHGAGSFGHFQAREHGVSKGSGDERFSWRGFALTRASVCRLNGLVLGALLGAGVAAVGVPPCAAFGATRGKGVIPRRARRRGLEKVEALLAAGLTPVLHGDAVLDGTQGTSILSGDTLVEVLADALRPRLCVFLTDVAGVYDRPPSEPGAALIPRLCVVDGDIRLPETSTAAHDVTGGLAAKLESAARIARAGTPVLIVEVGTESAAAALRGEVPPVCTVIEAASWRLGRC
mmetsp:Transcript_692/g.2021  ORF Transcript_692/g.2021 Transcript_692/m.2021 type:complete len:306 (-) Transcript_692:321-1238(-)